jgi:hypothetical protein
MFLSLQRLRELYPSVTIAVSQDGSTITFTGLPRINGGRQGIKCPKGWDLPTFKGGNARFVGPKSSMALENITEQVDIRFDVQEQQRHYGAMAGLSSASKQATTPTPVLEGDNLTATICVASAHASSLPARVVIVGTRSGCTIARLTVNVADILMGDDKSLCLQSVGLQFTFHRDIAEEAMVLLNQAHEEATEREGQLTIQQRLAECAQRAEEDADRCRNVAKATASSMPYNTFGGRDVISPVPTRDGRATTYVWTDEVNTPLHREIEPNALSGIEIAPSKKEQKALKKAERDAQKAQRDAEKAKRLEEERKANEAEEARRLQDLADIARVEQEHMEAENKAAEALKQWLEEPEAWRNQIATITTNAVQPVAQEEAGQPPIWGKTPCKNVANTLQALAKQRGRLLHVDARQYTGGPMYFIEVSALLATGILTLRVSAQGNEIVIGQPTDDGTHLWGTCVNVDHKSYGKIVDMFPEMDNNVCQVVDTRTARKVQKSHQYQYQHQHHHLQQVMWVPKPHQYQYQHQHHHLQQVMWVPYPLVMFNQQSAYPLYA